MLLGDPQQLRASRFACCDFALMSCRNLQCNVQRELRGRVGSATADAIDCAQCQLPRGSNDGTVIGATAVDGGGSVQQSSTQAGRARPQQNEGGWKNEMREQDSEPGGSETLCSGSTAAEDGGGDLQGSNEGLQLSGGQQQRRRSCLVGQ